MFWRGQGDSSAGQIGSRARKVHAPAESEGMFMSQLTHRFEDEALMNLFRHFLATRNGQTIHKVSTFSALFYISNWLAAGDRISIWSCYTLQLGVFQSVWTKLHSNACQDSNITVSYMRLLGLKGNDPTGKYCVYPKYVIYSSSGTQSSIVSQHLLKTQ